uniref:Gelsolin-like domain-containing protein n=1 Tax=Callorhinchus milii TaxID=7868 RepID=A0A4W3HQY4_CALMI
MLLEGVDVRRGYGKVSLGEGRAAEVSTVAVRVWHVAECEHRPLSPESHGQLHEADTYVVHWRYTVTSLVSRRGADQCGAQALGKERSCYFFWQGRASSTGGRAAAALVTVELGKESEAQVLVSQGKEPPCFLQLFRGAMVVHAGHREALRSPGLRPSPCGGEGAGGCAGGEVGERGLGCGAVPSGGSPTFSLSLCVSPRPLAAVPGAGGVGRGGGAAGGGVCVCQSAVTGIAGAGQRGAWPPCPVARQQSPAQRQGRGSHRLPMAD